MSLRFLGNKTKLASYILEEISNAIDVRNGPTIVDLFCGTAAISVALRQRCYRVIANDLLRSCAVNACAGLLSQGIPQFGTLFKHEGTLINTTLQQNVFPTPYDQALNYLNSLIGTKGFFYKEYSPEGSPENGASPRNYFTPQNAQRIDVIRQTIKDWHKNKLLNDIEHSILLYGLMLATNQVANTAGTYGYFLSHESKSSKAILTLKPSRFVNDALEHRVLNEDAMVVASKTSADVYYLDPPYTKRQYAAYYHILETIAFEDEPQVIGSTGLRPWEDKASDFCYKQRAAKALERLIQTIDAGYIFLSYSEDGHIKHDEILDILSERGEPQYINIEYQRYSSNGSKKGTNLKERLYKVRTK